MTQKQKKTGNNVVPFPTHLPATINEVVDVERELLAYRSSLLPSGRFNGDLPSREYLHEIAPLLERALQPISQRQLVDQAAITWACIPKNAELNNPTGTKIGTQKLKQLLAKYPEDIISKATDESILAGEWLLPFSNLTNRCERHLVHRKNMLWLVRKMLQEHDDRDREAAAEEARDARAESWFLAIGEDTPTHLLDGFTYKINGKFADNHYGFFYIAEKLGKPFLDEVHDAIKRGQIWTIFPLCAFPEKIKPPGPGFGLSSHDRDWALRLTAEAKARCSETDRPATQEEIQTALDTDYAAIVNAANNPIPQCPPDQETRRGRAEKVSREDELEEQVMAQSERLEDDERDAYGDFEQ